MAKFGPKAQKEIEKAMSEYKNNGRYQNREQAIAVGLSKARRSGGKAPKNPNS